MVLELWLVLLVLWLWLWLLLLFYLAEHVKPENSLHYLLLFLLLSRQSCCLYGQLARHLYLHSHLYSHLYYNFLAYFN